MVSNIYPCDLGLRWNWPLSGALCFTNTTCLSYFCTMFGSWVYHHGTMCHIHSWPLYIDVKGQDLWHQYWNNIFIMNLSLARLSLLFDIGIPNFRIWVYHHETICCVRSWLLYDLDLWPIGRWQGYPYWVILIVFIVL